MNPLARIVNALFPAPDMSLDNVPTKALEIDWRDEAVKKAAQRHGKPFLCGADSVPRERFSLDRKLEVVRPTATVTNIRRKK